MRDELVEIYKNGYSRMKHFLYQKSGYEYEYLFDDVIQDTFIKLLNNETYDIQKGEIKTYVYTCILNELYLTIKTTKKRNHHEYIYELENEEFEEYDYSEYVEILEMLKKNEMYVDKYQNGMNYKEICIKYNLTLNQAKQKIRLFKLHILKKYNMRLFFEYFNGEKQFYKKTHSTISNLKTIAKEKLKKKQ